MDFIDSQLGDGFLRIMLPGDARGPLLSGHGLTLFQTSPGFYVSAVQVF